ncbi:hypothetical protein BDZ45DRAFT_800455 [Acephala macrosclerotiorum]|nr:hypothetical protein BDZ45DRAFT_800455 [Acephala macrosclerotiorum]
MSIVQHSMHRIYVLARWYLTNTAPSTANAQRFGCSRYTVTSTITESLYSGLRAIQKSLTNDIRVWADALCINQDDFEERSAQILLMREIYHSAFVVRIWLGISSPDAARCFEFIEDNVVEEAFETVWQGAGETLGNSMFRIGQTFAEVGDIITPVARDDESELLLSPDENYSLHQESIEDISYWCPPERRLRKVEIEGDFAEISILMARIFIQHDWFTRMWVVQEVGAVSCVEMQIGSVAMGCKSIKEYKLQTYFTAKGRIDYFVVVDKEKGGVKGTAGGFMLLTKPEKELFVKLKKDYKDVKGDIEEQINIVYDFGDSKSERVLWLERIAFPYYTTTLKDEKIWSSYKLLPRKEFDAGSKDAEDPSLARVLIAVEIVLRDAYRLCSDTSPDRKMTQ